MSHAQSSNPPWTGIIDPSRAIDWSHAGVTGGIPHRTTNCSTLGVAGQAPTYVQSVTAAQINTAIQGCASGQVVYLNPGTYDLTSGITFGSTSNVTLRGAGANQTFLAFTGTAAGCNLPSAICIQGGNNSVGAEQNVCNWTAGYAPGTTTITLANCGSATPAKGSISNLKAGSQLILDQIDDSQDTGQIFNSVCNAGQAGSQCPSGSQYYVANTTQGGWSRTDGGSASGTEFRSQGQVVTVTGITVNGSGATVTISPGLYMPNWRSSQLPQAWFATGVAATNDGVENLSLDTSALSSGAYGNLFFNTTNDWLSGVRGTVSGRAHVEIQYASHITVQNSYFYQSVSHGTVSYTIEQDDAADDLIVNNICQQVTDSCPNNDGPAQGNVAAYNFAIDDVYDSAGWFQADLYQHTAGDAFNLYEGNIGPGYTADDVHGTHNFETLFRNRLEGDQNAGCGSAGVNTCDAETIPIHLFAASRYFNVVGNVLGRTGYHTSGHYQYLGNANGGGDPGYNYIYTLGATGNSGDTDSSLAGFCLQPSCSSYGDYDPQTSAYLLRWGNYDVVNNAVQWNSSEVPSTISPYGNAVPSSETLPPSFYYSSQPSWWPSTIPWPPIGPDVTGGNIGKCSGGTYANANAINASQCTGGTLAADLAGHANANPAMNCYLNTMGGPPDGTGGPLSFNSDVCYVQSSVPYGEVLAGDTSVTLNDAVAVAQYAIGLPVTINVAAAEVDGTSTVTLNDAVLIAQYVVGLITKFPVQS